LPEVSRGRAHSNAQTAIPGRKNERAMRPFIKFQLISIPIITIAGIVLLLINWKFFNFWINTSFFIWNWGSCYYLAPALEKKFEESLEKEELWSRFKKYLGGKSWYSAVVQTVSKNN